MTLFNSKYYSLHVRSHYRRADGALLVYDVADPESFEKLDGWLKDLREIAGDSIKSIMILENKIDQLPERITGKEARPSQYMNEDTVRDYCRSNGLLFARTSAKMNNTAFKWEGQKVSDIVSHLVLNIHATQLARGLKAEATPSSIPEVKIVLKEDSKSSRGVSECGACTS